MEGEIKTFPVILAGEQIVIKKIDREFAENFSKLCLGILQFKSGDYRYKSMRWRVGSNPL